jgi:hypothetical protein
MRESIDPILTGKPTLFEPAPIAHRLDEFPAGYPLAGCSPAEPASVSPTAARMPQNGSAVDDSPANGNLSLSQLSQGWGSVHEAVPNFRKFRCFPYRRFVLITIGVPSKPNFSLRRLIRKRSAEKCMSPALSVNTMKVGGRTLPWVM